MFIAAGAAFESNAGNNWFLFFDSQFCFRGNVAALLDFDYRLFLMKVSSSLFLHYEIGQFFAKDAFSPCYHGSLNLVQCVEARKGTN